MKNSTITTGLMTITLVAFFYMIGSVQAQTLEIHAYKSSSSSIVKLNADSVAKAWNSETPVCVKDGSKIVGVNAAYTKKGLGYRDCSDSDKAKEKQRMLGYTVMKIDFTSLPDALAKQFIN